MTAAPDILRQIPMLDDLQQSERIEIASCFTPIDIEAGELLYREGDPATDACFLLSGELDALKELPGGDATVIGSIMPGALIGEMALVAGGSRTATVRARCGSKALQISSHFFQAALEQMSVPAFKILRSVIHTMAARLDDLHENILRQSDCDSFIATFDLEPPEGPSGMAPTFDHRPFLSALRCFENFRDSEIDETIAAGEVYEIFRAEHLYREGAPAPECFLILRGAIERSIIRDRRYQLSVLGPGRLCGANALICRRNHVADARVRSQALLLRLDRAGFDRLFHGHTRAAMKFQTLVAADLLAQLTASDNLLALLINQNYVSGGTKRCTS